jgi:23S rRNA pseudouridine1911/1915/1917 synthase
MSNLINQKKFLIDVPEGKRKERIDTFLTHHIENTTRSKIQKAIESGLVKVNGFIVKANYNVRPFDKIEAIQIISPRPEDVEPEEIPLDIVYEDDFLIIVNKPAGMVAHPAYANYTGTLVNALLHHTKSLSSINEAGRPGIVHRIDKDTSGLLVVAKDATEREYHAICWGKFKEKEGEINTKIARSKSDRKKFTISDKEGKEAITLYKVIEQFEFTSYIKLNLKTGRTHQIRVHLSGLGKPIFGDVTYGGNKIHAGLESQKLKSRIQNLLEIMPRQALHAKTLGFIHPHTNKFVRFDSELPEDFKSLLENLQT